MVFTGVKPSEITFQRQLSQSRFAVIFLVVVRDTTCVMKVHHGRGPKQYYESPDRETNIHVCESTAYRRLDDFGLCDRGIVPRFYGVIEPLDPKLCLPHLKMFLNDNYLPNAILLEHIPNMRMLHWTNYTRKRMQNFLTGIREIHNALIEHSDVYPRNMMVVDDDPERVIWIDFDRAQTFDASTLTERQQGWLDYEYEIVKDIMSRMEADFQEGRMNRTARLYY